MAVLGVAMQQPRDDGQWSRIVTRVAGGLVTALGVVVLVVGWWLGVDAVTRVLPGLESMKANTALAFVLLGVGLLIVGSRRHHELRPVTRALAVAVVVIGVLTTVEYATGTDLGIDELLVTDPAGTMAPGRMGLNSALAFIGTGFGLVAVGRRAPSVRLAGQTLTLLAGVIATFTFLGYVYGATAAWGLASGSETALLAAVGFLAVVAGITAALSDVGLIAELRGGTRSVVLARRTLSAAMLGIVVSATIGQALRQSSAVSTPDLVLAVTATLSIVVVGFAVLAVARSLRIQEEQSLDAAASLAAILGATGDVHLEVGADGVVRRRHGDRAFLGWDRDAVGQDLVDLYPPSVSDRIAAALQGGRVSPGADSGHAVTYTLEHGGAWAVTRELRFVRLPEDSIGVVDRDVTAVAVASQMLEQMNVVLEDRVAVRTQELEDANRELERFAYVASHDLQEPLRMVTAFVSRIEDGYGELFDDRGRQYLHFAVDGARRMSELITALLELSRVGTGPLESVAEVSLQHLVADVLATMRARIAEADATVEVDDGLPMVAGDPVLLHQVLQNLVANALKFRHADRAPVVRITADTTAEHVVVTVADNGIGIPESYVEDIFEMFRRLHGREAYEGTGIGLAIVARIIDRHGGDITVASTENRGASFRFTLPHDRAGER